MDRLTIFGLLAVTAMLVTYALEKRSHWFVLAFAGSCMLGSGEDAPRQAGFEIVSHDDHFIDWHLDPQRDPQTDDLWWLVIARKP